MATNPTSSAPGAIVVDASISVAISAKEADNEPSASAQVLNYSGLGYEFFAPGVIVSETLFVLCKKLEAGSLSAMLHAQAIKDFEFFMRSVLPAPGGDKSLILRAEAIRANYSCRHSADGLYIALAEELSKVRPTALLTFDSALQSQAKKNAPMVNVIVL